MAALSRQFVEHGFRVGKIRDEHTCCTGPQRSEHCAGAFWGTIVASRMSASHQDCSAAIATAGYGLDVSETHALTGVPGFHFVAVAVQIQRADLSHGAADFKIVVHT